MSSDGQCQTYWQRISSYAKNHRVSVSLLLSAYGVIYLTSVVLGGWTLADWGKDVTGYPQPSILPLLPRGFINPLFFVTSLPALFIGTISLCIYRIRGISPKIVDNKEHVAILLTACGFIYQIIGTWPLGNLVDFQWEWQKQILRNGAAFAWSLYILSLAALLVGGTSVYIHSRIYHQRHPEVNIVSKIDS